MKKIFLDNDSQLRSGWKIFIAFGVFLGLGFVLSLIVIILSDLLNIGTQIQNSSLEKYIILIITPLSMILSCLFFWKLLDKKPFKEMGMVGMKYGFKDFVIGLTMGALSITGVFIILYLTGSVEIKGSLLEPYFSISLISYLILFILVGFGEEIFSRGYCITVLKKKNNIWVAVFVSSILFSLLHYGNPNMCIVGYINIFCVGLLLAFMFLRSGNLWMPIGYHITWNYFQGNVYGFEVSGLPMEGIYRVVPVKSDILNGGDFGPEGGIVTTAILIIGFYVIWVFYRKKKQA